jgi:hypothetical protein
MKREEVYNGGNQCIEKYVEDVSGSIELKEYEDWRYYQTYGGGPSGGYITDGKKVAAVNQNGMFHTWTVTPMPNRALIFYPGNEMKGIPDMVQIKKINRGSHSAPSSAGGGSA